MAPEQNTGLVFLNMKNEGEEYSAKNENSLLSTVNDSTLSISYYSNQDREWMKTHALQGKGLLTPLSGAVGQQEISDAMKNMESIFGFMTDKSLPFFRTKKGNSISLPIMYAEQLLNLANYYHGRQVPTGDRGLDDPGTRTNLRGVMEGFFKKTTVFLENDEEWEKNRVYQDINIQTAFSNSILEYFYLVLLPRWRNLQLKKANGENIEAAVKTLGYMIDPDSFTLNDFLNKHLVFSQMNVQIVDYPFFMLNYKPGPYSGGEDAKKAGINLLDRYRKDKGLETQSEKKRTM